MDPVLDTSTNEALLVGPHCFFAKKGTVIPGQPSGTVVDALHKPNTGAIEGVCWKIVGDVLKVKPGRNITKVKARKPSPCVLRTSKQVVTEIERTYDMTLESITRLGMELMFGTQFDSDTNIGEIDSLVSFEGWWMWMGYDDYKEKSLIVNAYGQLTCDDPPECGSEDFIKMTCQLEQYYTPIKNNVKFTR